MSNLKKAIEEIEKKYGKGTLMKIGESLTDIDVIPTPSKSLNRALGVGGIPKGRLTEFYGKQSSGKTTLAAHIIAEAQKENEMCVYLDVENAVDLKYFENIGINLKENFLLSQPNSGESCLDILQTLLESREVGVIVLDSIAALVPEAEMNGEMNESTIGLQARMLSKAMRKLTPLIGKSNTAVIFINQLRSNISTFGYGPKSVTSGGRALPYYYSIRIELANIGQIKTTNDIVGNKIKATIKKNKVASPFQIAEYDIIYGEGINDDRLFIDEAVKAGFIKKSGSWFSYGDERLGQGLEKVKQFLKENPEIKQEISDKLI